MTYTDKMYKALRRDTIDKQNCVTDLLDEIDKLNKNIDDIILYFEKLSENEDDHWSCLVFIEEIHKIINR